MTFLWKIKSKIYDSYSLTEVNGSMNHFIYLGLDLFLTSFFFNVKKKSRESVRYIREESWGKDRRLVSSWIDYVCS